MFLIIIFMQLLITMIRLFFIGYIIRLIFRNTKYGRYALIISVIYHIFLLVTNITTATYIINVIASILSLILYVYVYDRHQILKPKKLKGMDTQFRTKHADQIFFIALTSITWFLAILLYVLIGSDLILYVFLLLFNVISFILIFYVKEENVYLIVGKNEKQLYEYPIPKKVLKYAPVDFFQSDDYIIDYVGVMYENRIKTHLYMLPVDQLHPSIFSNATRIEFHYEFLGELKKYQFVSITFKEKTPRLKRLK